MPSGTTAHPMTVEQESMWVDDHMGDAPSRYVESWVCRLRGPVDREALSWALERIVARHEALRSRFVLDDDRLVQLVLPEEEQRPALETVACSAASLDGVLEELVRRPLDAAESPLRATLVEVAADTAVLVVQLHHLVIDDWALQTFEQEFAEHYGARVEGRPAAVGQVPLQPGGYAVEQRSRPRDPAVRAYWREVLRDLPADAARTLAADRPGAGEGAVGRRSDRGDRLIFAIDADLAARVRVMCRKVRATPFVLFASVVAVLMHSAQGARDVIVGTPVSHRGTADRDRMIAPLSELMPLRLGVCPERSFADLVRHVRTRVHEALAHKDVSYAELAAMARRRGTTPDGRDLCRTVIVVDDMQPSRIELPGVDARRLYVHSGVSKFDLCLTLVAQERGYLGFLEYALDLFDRERAQGVLADFVALLERVCDADAPDMTPAQLMDGRGRRGDG